MTIQAKLLFDLIGPRSLARFDARCEHPLQEQEQLLRRLLHENVDTEFGRRHRFDRIDSFPDFQKQVPVIDYEDIEPLIDAARHGEPHQLTREPPIFYALTSGTTGARKYIPVTETSRRAKARLMRVWLSGLFRDHPGILNGGVLQIASPEVEEYAPDGTPCGAEAGHAYRNMPKLMKGLYPVPYEVCEIRDYEARYYALLRLAIVHSITAIGTPNPSTILLLARCMGDYTERLVRDVRDGTLDPDVNIPSEIRDLLESTIVPDPERAAFLEGAASGGDGRLVPRHVWPELEVLACWKGGTVGPYLDQLGPCFPDGLPIRDLGWLSSECRGSVPLGDEGGRGPLAVATNIYEFLPADQDPEPPPAELLTVDQVEEGGQYYVYVSTSGGLFRYAMHDILEVTGFHRQTPSVRFVQKGKGIVSFTGEKLTETQVLEAVEETLGTGRGEYSFVAAVGQPTEPSYLFLIEFETPPDRSEATRIVNELEQSLTRHNVEYAAKRGSGRLGPPVLRVLEPGQFDAYQREALREGAPDGQFKIMRLTDDAAFADHFDRVVGDYRAA
ncbi:MAG: hypothetical protein GEU90_11485 [Gemmatimonas sp.]|nr:hypothetical protein [Gemmatimonas sp.]